MKFKVWDENEEREKPVLIRVFERGTRIVLDVVDETGKPRHAGHILCIKEDGTFSRYNGLTRDLGFSTNENGQITETPIF